MPAALRHIGGNWFGADQLWVDLWWADSGSAVGRSGDPHYPYGVKYGSFTLKDGRMTSAYGHPTIHVKRVDGPGRANTGFGGYAHTGSADFWPTGLGFSTPGCWRITESVGHTTIHFVLAVSPKRRDKSQT